ncbi:MAG TPA: energy transducer TonB [Sphingomicrobium sp.]|nr:energy transducer TonB [Sphingomicrobium sp.]
MAWAEPLHPSGAWDLNYEETQCVAARKYGNPADPVTLAIRQSPNGETYEILVGWKHRVSEPLTEEDSTVDFGNGPITALALFYETAAKTVDVHSFRISAADMAQARSASRLAVRISGSADLTFDLASMPQVLEGLQTCTENLKQYWNMSGEKDGRVTTPARGDLRSIFSSDDYPRLALRRGQAGAGQYLLLVDETGKVAGCQVLLATGAPVLDTMACSIIEDRAKFTPARDRNGKPVRSTVVTPRIIWSLGR